MSPDNASSDFGFTKPAVYVIKIQSRIFVTLKIFTSLILISGSLVSYAQEAEEESKNAVSIFLGGTSNEDATAFTLGVDYQYRINRIVGVGALIDYAMGDIQSLLIAPAVYLHAGHFEVTVAPAAEFSEEDVSPVLSQSKSERC
jgi:hypothetical protein